MKKERTITVVPALKSKIQKAEEAVGQRLRVAAYARVSTEQDEQESSYEAQVDFYTRHIQSNPNWEFVGVFADRGITGTNTKNRESFNRMISLALEGGIDLILTKSISRFARNTVDTLQTVRELKGVGVEVVFEKENLHTLDPKCEVMLAIMSSLAQEESRSISENVRWGQQKSMRDGKVFLPYKHFLGYKKGADGYPEIVEEEAAIVRQIYDMFLSGKSIRHIADYLTEQGVPTPTGKSRWPVSTVENILRNEKYKGEALLQKSYTVDYLSKKTRKNDGELPQYHIENSHEPIISPEIFDLVQKRLEHRRGYKARFRDNSPLSNKLICADCGGFYGHKVWHNRENTKRYDIWYCNRRYASAEKCKTPILRENEIKMAFERICQELGIRGGQSHENLWNEMVEVVMVYPDRRLIFHMIDSREAEVII